MLTILGQHISLIRPELIYRPKIYKNERPRAKYNYCNKPKTVKENTGKVIAVCIKLTDDKIKSITLNEKTTKKVAVTHLYVCQQLNINYNEIKTTGWQLENGNYIWR